MNKILVLFVISLLAITGVLATGQGSDSQGTGSEDNGEQNDEANGTAVNLVLETQNQGENSEINAQVQTNNPETGNMDQIQTQDQEGYSSVVSNNGESIQIKSENGFGLKSNGVEAKSQLQLRTQASEDGENVKVMLSNGKEADVKIMPNTASETAIQKLGLNNCVVEEGCTIELKEVGKGEEMEPVYEVETETEGKFLGLFKTRAKVKAQVSAETGEIVRIKKPFLTSVKTTE
ncbi:MAG: hypothetical protein ACP5N2_07195 [Candidatus Nanoarchaeia archaeon]